MIPKFSLRSIRTRLMLWNILTLSLLMAVLGIVIHFMVQRTIYGMIERELEHRTNDLVRLPPRDHGGRPLPRDGQNLPPWNNDMPPPGDDFHTPEQDSPSAGGNFNSEGNQGRKGDDTNRFPPRFPTDNQDNPMRSPYRPHRYDVNGKSLEHHGTANILDTRGFALARAGNMVSRRILVNDEPVLVVSRPFPAHGAVQGVVQAGYSLTEVNQAVALVNKALLFLSPVALLFAGMGGALLTNQVLGRVRQLDWVASRISARDFGKRLPVVGNDEFAALATTFNGLLGRLEAAFQEQARLMEQQRRFTADASHELKTPLTIIKGTASMALTGTPTVTFYRESLQEIRGAAETMGRLVQDLLLLARSDGGQLGRNPIELLVREVIERAISSVVPSPAVPITLRLTDESLTLCGNEMELIRLFRNLLDNAIHYTPTGTITVSAMRDRGFIVITVTDTGIGIAPQHLPHLGERFYRIDDSRSRPDGGTGLGLSICEGIVQAHGGSIHFKSTVGLGTTVTVLLPIEATPLAKN